jgi:molybdopterin converting factor small subunit
MNVSLRLIGSYRRLLPPGTNSSVLALELPLGTTVAEVMTRFEVPLTDDSVVVVNGLTVDWRTPLEEGDEISAFSAMAGG